MQFNKQININNTHEETTDLNNNSNNITTKNNITTQNNSSITASEAYNNLINIINKSFKLFAPPPKLTVSEWADKYRYLSSESSAETGKWRTSRAEYQRGIMDVATDPRVKNVVFMSSAQVGKTEILNNVCGYLIDQNPKPILFLQPTLEMAETWSKDRFAPMIRDTEVLRNKISNPKTRASGNTLLHKSFIGGHITIAGANSPSSLASRPICRVFCDEVDRYPLSAGSEGDPVALARKRTTTFYDAQTWEVSTPTIKGISRIEARYEESDKRKYHVPCPYCNKLQVLKWSNVIWAKEEIPDSKNNSLKSKEDLPETASYVCEHCNKSWNDAQRYKAVAKGIWLAENEHKKFNGTVGFWLNELYSPWIKLSSMVQNFLLAKKNTETLKTFINTSLGETWEETEELEGIDENTLINRTEHYKPTDKLNNRILIITAGVDTQNDRIEFEIVGWGQAEESWSIDYKIIYGNPSNKEVWKELELILNEQEYSTQDNRILRISATAIDTGGHHTDDVYSFCKAQQRKAKRVFAIKGYNIQGKPIAPAKASIVGREKLKLFMIGTDTAKEVIYSRLRIERNQENKQEENQENQDKQDKQDKQENNDLNLNIKQSNNKQNQQNQSIINQQNQPIAGYCHFPKHYTEEYFKQLTSEKIKIIFEKGKKKRQWVKIRPRNEALDCRVYALSALKILNPNFKLIKIDNEKELLNLKKEEQQMQNKERIKQTQTNNNWLNEDYENWI